MTTRNLCMACGACCATFRVSFPIWEAEVSEGGIVPVDFTVIIDNSRRAMKGTEGRKKRCVGLNGVIGYHVCCGIYEHRPSPCRGFLAAWNNSVNAVCDRARAIHGLQPFSNY